MQLRARMQKAQFRHRTPHIAGVIQIMKFEEPKVRHPTRQAIDKLASYFGLPNTLGMQDWELNIASWR